MPSPVTAALQTPPTPWLVAARLVARWLERRERLDVLLDELERRDLQTGLVAMCTGGGMGTATIIERL